MAKEVGAIRQRSNRRWPLALLWVAVLANLGCRDLPPNEVTLTLLATNDFHGALISESKDPESGRHLGGAAVLAATIAREAAVNPEGTLVLDGGDSFHGSALSNLTKGRATIDFMNLTGFDATVVGNHGFDWGVPVLLERIAQAEFPFLVANIREKASGEPPGWTRPYHLFERQGVRIAVIGLITASTPWTTLPKNVESLEFLDPAPVANQLIEELVPAKADIAVLLCHLGLRRDRESGLLVGDLVEMTGQVRGVAAIIGGHLHQTYAGKVDEIPVVLGGHSGQHLARIDLVVDRHTHRVIRSEERILKVFADAALTPEAAVAALVESYREGYEETMRQVIGEAARTIEYLFRDECQMGNLFTDAIRQQNGADFVFQNRGGLRDSLTAGPITRKDVFRVMPFDNTIVLVRMSGAEVMELLEQAVENSNFIFASGLRYSIDRAQPAGSRVTVSPPLDSERLYEVSINNFLAQGGDGLSLLVGRPGARDTGILLRDALVDWITQETGEGRKIDAQVDGRIAR